jgi:hypothetical protein
MPAFPSAPLLSDDALSFMVPLPEARIVQNGFGTLAIFLGKAYERMICKWLADETIATFSATTQH